MLTNKLYIIFGSEISIVQREGVRYFVMTKLVNSGMAKRRERGQINLRYE